MTIVASAGDLVADFFGEKVVLVAGGAIVTWVAAKASRVLPNRRLWQLKDPDHVVICTAASTTTHTGQYVRPATGIGQVRALALLLPSLSRAYRNVDIGQIRLSTEPLREERERDLICLGGTKNNRLTAELLEELGDRFPVAMDDSIIEWDGEPYEGDVEDDRVTVDYGLIIQTSNPYADGRTLVLLAGSHTYGTIAAARYFVEHYSRLRRWRENDFATLVKAKVEDEHVCPPTLVASVSARRS